MSYRTEYPESAASDSVVQLEYTDIDQQAAQLTGYNQAYQQLSPGRFSGAFLTCAYDSHFAIYIEQLNCKLFQLFEVPTDQYAVCIMMNSSERSKINSIPFESDQTLVLAPGTRALVGTGNAMRVCVISIEQRFFENHILFESVPALTRMPDDVSIVQTSERIATKHLIRSIELSIKKMSLMSDRSTDAYGSFVHDNKLALLSSVFATLCNEEKLNVVKTDESNVGPATTFSMIQNSICSDLSVIGSIPEICEQHGMSRRAVENYFRSFLDTSPNAYIKALRLNHARRDLRSERLRHLSIGDIAGKWGLWHPSRFANEYRTMFDELPSETRENSLTKTKQ